MEKNLYFYNGEGKCKNQQIALNNPKTVLIKDVNSEFIVEDIKNIEVRCCDEYRSKIKLDHKTTYYSHNKKIAITEKETFIAIQVVNNEDQLREFESMVIAQEAHGLVDYILDNAPELYTQEKLAEKTLEELKLIKEELDDLANSY